MGVTHGFFGQAEDTFLKGQLAVAGTHCGVGEGVEGSEGRGRWRADVVGEVEVSEAVVS